MSEQVPHEDFDDIVAKLSEDSDFQDSIFELNDAMTEADSSDEDHSSDAVHPYYTEPINDVGEYIHQTFLDLCKVHNVDVNSHEQSYQLYTAVWQELALSVYALKNRLWPGDTIRASGAIVLDLGSEDDTKIGLYSIGGSEAIVGRFHSPIIGAIPDEALLLTMGEGTDSNKSPIGVGLALEDAVVIDEFGDVHYDMFEGKNVVIALGSVGLSLEKLHFQADD